MMMRIFFDFSFLTSCTDSLADRRPLCTETSDFGNTLDPGQQDNAVFMLATRLRPSLTDGMERF
jgi:hypothetical protein